MLDEFDLLILIIESERILNNRPITYLLSSTDELLELTSRMILTDSIFSGVTPGVFMKADTYRQLWRKTQYLANQFWSRWLKEYLPLLQPRRKWFGSSRTLKPDDLVFIVDKQASRECLPKGIVEAVMPDNSSLVRRVKV